MKILHIVYNLIRGGTEGQCARFALELVRQDATQRVAVFRREGFFLDLVEAACGPVLCVKVSHLVSVGAIRAVATLRQFILSEGIDLVHAWDADAAVFGSAAARWAGVPYITSRRDLGQIYARRKLWLMKWADRGAAAVVVNAEAIRRHMLEAGLAPARVFLLHNILDVAEFDAAAVRPFSVAAGLGPGPCVACVARLNAEKDVATFIRAARKVRDRRPDAVFVVVGDGPERGALESLAAELKISDAMVFLGDITEVPALLKHMSAGVLVPSRNEGLSNSILEYMAAGLPVVATDCGGNRELVEDGVTGFVAPCGHADRVAEAIVRLLEDPSKAKAMGGVGRARVVQGFAPAVLARRMKELYDGALKRGAGD